MILDAGAFVAVDRDDRAMIARLIVAHQQGEDLRSHPLVIAQVWRGGRRQERLARMLKAVEIVSLDDDLGRRCGTLLGKTGTTDSVDAAVVLLARHGDSIVTSEAKDIT